MQKNKHTNILDETIIEINETCEETVSRLMAQQGLCRTEDSQAIPLWFYCDKKGRISISNNARYTPNRIYSVKGKVITEDGTTKVKIQTLHNRSTVIMRIIDIISDFLVLGIYVLFLILKNPPLTIRDLIPIPIIAINTLRIFFHTNKEKNNKTTDIAIMKQEIINRVEAVKRWDD